MEGTLYLVATPIGNMEDITLRALRILKEVDIIACEDTRHSLALLSYYDIKKPLVSYYKQKEQEGSQYIINELKNGKNIALITDAGMCCISDPGSVVVKNAQNEGLKVTVIPGASAVVSAFALSGITETTGFCFLGFMPEQNKQRNEVVEKFASCKVPLIFYMSPHNILKDCKFLLDKLGDREIVVVKEITKIYETVIKTKLSELSLDNTKGEYVLIVKPNKDENPLVDMSIEEHIRHYLECGMDKKTAIKQVAKDRNISKNEVYQVAINIAE